MKDIIGVYSLLFLALTAPHIPLVSSEICGGVQCLDSQYCDDTMVYCVPKLNLDLTCPKAGSCLPTNSECLGEESAKTCQCVGSFVPFLPQNQCIPGCTTDANCVIPSAYCNTELGGCLPKVNLNDACIPAGPSDQQCSTENAVCSENVCKCTDPFVEKGGQCLRSCTAAADPLVCNSATEYCDVTSGLCTSKAYLGQSCSSVGQCIAENSECDTAGTGTCSCLPGFKNYYNSACIDNCLEGDEVCEATQYCHQFEEICFPKANLHQSCHSGSADSCALENTECVEQGGRSTCECKTDFAEQNGQCLNVCSSGNLCNEGDFCNTDGLCEAKRGLGQPCSGADASEECQAEFVCAGQSSPRCSCPPDQIEDKGQCIAKCESNANCESPTQYCSKVTGRCILKAELNGWCDQTEGVTEQCKTTDSLCTDGRCLCIDSHVQNRSSCILKCETEGCLDPSLEFCNLKTHLCSEKVSLEGVCDPTEGSGQCLDGNADCQEQKGENKCLCNSGFGGKNGACVPQCSSTAADCGPNEYCDTEDSKLCWDKATLGENCKYDDQCRTTGAACEGPDNDRKCSCKAEFVSWFGSCLERCTESTVCNDNQFCKDDGLCEIKRRIGQECEEDKNCVATTICAESGSGSQPGKKVCRCNQEAYQSGAICIQMCNAQEEPLACNALADYCDHVSGKCTPLVGPNFGCTEPYQCTNLTDCKPNSQEKLRCLCVANAAEDVTGARCDCNGGFVQSQNVKRCLKVAGKLGDACEEVSQCTPIGNGKLPVRCNANKCACNANFVADGDRNCQKSYAPTLTFQGSFLVLTLFTLLSNHFL